MSAPPPSSRTPKATLNGGELHWDQRIVNNLRLDAGVAYSCALHRLRQRRPAALQSSPPDRQQAGSAQRDPARGPYRAPADSRSAVTFLQLIALEGLAPDDITGELPDFVHQRAAGSDRTRVPGLGHQRALRSLTAPDITFRQNFDFLRRRLRQCSGVLPGLNGRDRAPEHQESGPPNNLAQFNLPDSIKRQAQLIKTSGTNPCCAARIGSQHGNFGSRRTAARVRAPRVVLGMLGQDASTINRRCHS
jgi:hypothetical protein